MAPQFVSEVCELNSNKVGLWVQLELLGFKNPLLTRWHLGMFQKYQNYRDIEQQSCDAAMMMDGFVPSGIGSYGRFYIFLIVFLERFLILLEASKM